MIQENRIRLQSIIESLLRTSDLWSRKLEGNCASALILSFILSASQTECRAASVSLPSLLRGRLARRSHASPAFQALPPFPVVADTCSFDSVCYDQPVTTRFYGMLPWRGVPPDG